jgi:drug/metabolite transporter (DMT)-like permease
LVFARRHPFRTFLRRDLWPRFILMGLLDGGSLLAYFYAVRATGVAVATFLLFVQPVWVALLAPRLLKAPTERLVYLSLGVALAGLAVILAPDLTGGGTRLSAAGVAVGLVAGILYAFFQLLIKDLARELPSTTIVTLECTLDAVVILPLALIQFMAVGVVLSGRDWIAGAVLGLVCTAVAYSIWVEGVGRIPVQHSAILGLLTPVVAPLFAWGLLGEGVTVFTAVGGVLILAAGAGVVVFGSHEMEPEPPL